MNRYEEALDDWASQFADAAAFDSEVLAYEAAFAEEDTDKVMSLKQLPNYVAQPPVAAVPQQFRNIGYGEITSTSPAASRTGLANLNQDLIYRDRRQGATGRPTLVQYDSQGNVIMRILSDDQRRILWQGTIGRIRMPTVRGAGQRGQHAERRVRDLVAQKTGRRFRRHAPTARGADLIAIGTARPRRRRAGRARRVRRGRQRFESFDDFLDDITVL
jgi:hypothetical protein